jgi:peptidoglycan DL-endopeptidase LytE
VKKTIISVTATAILSTSFVGNASASEYKVKPGDSLWSIASQHKIPLDNIRKWNNLKGDMIYPNQVLKVMKISSVPPSQKVQAPVTIPKVKESATYTVKSGDTLSLISKLHSVSVAEISSLNNLKDHLIYPGQKLKLSGEGIQPVTVTPSAPSKPTDSSTSGSGNTYTIKPGDTLSGISLKYKVSVQDIKEWNQLKSDLIFSGQKLIIKEDRNQTQQPSALPEESKQKPVSESNMGDKKDIISQSMSYLGTPYSWGGNSPKGFDCSGFVYYVFEQTGSTIGRHSSEGYYNRSYYVHTPSPGDLVFFENTYKKGISHLGIYLGNNEFIHAGDNGVVITSLNNPYWKSKFDGFKRFY